MENKSRQLEYILLAAMTIDGKIARSAHHFSDWTSREDKDFLHQELDQCDVVVVGNNTYETAKKPLSKRTCIVFTRSVDTLQKVPPNLTYCNPSGYSLPALLQELGHQRIAVLGGTETYNYFLDHDLVDTLHLTIEPLVFGNGLSLFSSMQGRDLRFRLESSKQLNDRGSLLLTYTRP